MSSKTFDKEYLGLGGFVWFFGVVEDIMDPLKVGRVRVRCYDWHPSDKSSLPTDQIPWAQVLMPANNAAVSGIGTSLRNECQNCFASNNFHTHNQVLLREILED